MLAAPPRAMAKASVATVGTMRGARQKSLAIALKTWRPVSAARKIPSAALNRALTTSTQGCWSSRYSRNRSGLCCSLDMEAPSGPRQPHTPLARTAHWL